MFFPSILQDVGKGNESATTQKEVTTHIQLSTVYTKHE